MKLRWMANVERYIPFSAHGFMGNMIRFVDGTRDWRPISTAPFNNDVELCLIENDWRYVLPFPCRQTRLGWMNSDLDVHLKITPTEWRRLPEESRTFRKAHAKPTNGKKLGLN